jgi:type II secretory pathway component GspD/PulD (secretin)
MKSYRVTLIAAVLILAGAFSAAAQDKGSALAQVNRPRKAEPGPDVVRTITLNINKAEIGDALRLVAEQGGLNLVIGPDVKGEVSVYLSNARLDTALKSIAVNNGFVYSVDEGVISVAKPMDTSATLAAPPMITRVFTLRSMDAERVRDALEYALTRWGKMKVLNENSQPGYGVTRLDSLGGDMSGSGGGGSGSGSSGSSGRSSSGNSSNSSNSNNINSGSGATGPGGMGGSNQARNAQKLVVTDVKENVDRIAELIADLDKLPPQVLIEARIIEMSTNLQRQLGIDWNVNVLANGPLMNHQLPLDWKAGFAGGSQIMYRRDGSAYNSTGLALGTIDLSQFSALLRVHATDNAVRLLANPRLLVYNNHSASILVGERYPILQANITDFGTVTEAFDTYIPVGVQLEVTPTIMLDGTISMLVHPATSALGDDVVGTTGLKVARILTREIDTRVIMKDGQTIVLGGLISDRNERHVDKIPGLGDIPVLDMLFRQESPHSDRVDLLIFLTAHLEDATQLSERDQRVYDMYKPQFKQIQRSQDVPLHFEIPTEYETPKPLFGDPVDVADDDAMKKTARANGEFEPIEAKAQPARCKTNSARTLGEGVALKEKD